jgi:hypothetical protein
MNLDQERRIHRLLLQREREFTAVWRAECEINKILGAEYSFAAPPDLPSSYKPIKSKVIRAGKQKIQKLNTIIRSLSLPENAYRVVYTSEGEEFSSFQMDTNLLRQVLPVNSPVFSIESIETVQLRSLENFDVVETLWEKGDLFLE